MIRISGIGPAPGFSEGMTQFGPFAPGTRLRSLIGSVAYSASPSYAGLVVGVSPSKLSAVAEIATGCSIFLTDGSEPSAAVQPAAVMPHSGTAQLAFAFDLPLDYVFEQGGWLVVYMEVTTMFSTLSAIVSVRYDDPEEVVARAVRNERDAAAGLSGKVPRQPKVANVAKRGALPLPVQSQPTSTPGFAPVPRPASSLSSGKKGC